MPYHARKLRSHKHVDEEIRLVSLLCCVLLCKDSKFNMKQIGMGNFKSDPNVLAMVIHF